MNALLTADETANDLFRRIDKCSFTLRLSSNQTEEFFFQENVEVITQPSEVAEFVLSCALDFASQVEEGVMIHISLGDNFHRALRYSGMDITASPLYHLNEKGKVKAFTIQSLSQLLALSEFLRSVVVGRNKVLVLLEGLTCLFATQKSLHGLLSPTSLAASTLTSFQRLCQLHSVTCLWVNSAAAKGIGGLREGNFRDPVTTLWRQKVPRVLRYVPNR